MEQRIPSPESVRAMREQLKRGVTEDEQETIEELMATARERVEAALSPEVRAVLAVVPPQLLEVYAILQQPVPLRVKVSTQARADEGARQAAQIRSGAAQELHRPAVAGRQRTLREEDDEGAMTMEIEAENEQEQELLNTLAGMMNQSLPIGQIPRGQALQVSPPVTFTMQLDAFQGAYKGLVEITQGKGRNASKTTETIAVHKAIYEDEQARVGAAVKQPPYWLPKHNSMTVYFPGRDYEIEVAWLLGDYDPQHTGIPAGTDPTPEQIAQYLQEGVDDEEWEIEVIKRHLRTSEQKAWMDKHDISIADVLNGRIRGDLDVEGMLFDNWNTKLGVKVYGF
jgi:hypothetical protein